MSKSPHNLALIACLAAASLLALLMASPMVNALPHGALFLSVMVIVFEVVVPLEIIKWYGLKPRDFNIYVHHIDAVLDIPFPPYGALLKKPDYNGLFLELAVFLKISLLVFLPYCLAYAAFFHLRAVQLEQELFFSFSLPDKLWYEALVQIFVVALPEELFYRGFLQGSLLKVWPQHKPLWLPGRAILLTNLFFALGHVVGTLSPERLLTFFPGLIFSYLTLRNKSIFSTILFHALCNIIGAILYQSFYMK
jgi:membrane protease YdiL (CAAX protease family)